MKIYTIIITYNGDKWIEKNIQALIDSSTKTKIIIIDNGSVDGTQDIVKSFKAVQFIQSEENLGFGKANNLGIKLALEQGADYIFLLNQDAWIEKNTLSKLLKVSEIDKSFGIISPLHLNGGGTGLDKLFSHCIAPSIHHLDHYYFSDLTVKQVKEFYQVPFINAAAWLLPKNTFKKVGFFDKLFYHYGEDVNYCHRVNYHNLKIVFVPDAKFFHDREDRDIKNEDKDIKRNLKIELANVIIPKNEILKKFKYFKKYYLKCTLKDFLKFRSFSSNFELYMFIRKNMKKILTSYHENKHI
ncbi:MAG: family 2 glycosyl transferase [Crocinitomicaceae bacterium]|nr:family 2 glycosyl transferase [Crocinitomicaceae bacterium]|tara:strand:- start:1523 stop:2419 length:897 start_codon:yes stop_codon:yes gene_type:complete